MRSLARRCSILSDAQRFHRYAGLDSVWADEDALVKDEEEPAIRLGPGNRQLTKRRLDAAGLARAPHKYPTARVRILDLDEVPIKELHTVFLGLAVRRLPAEALIKVASRLASYRDKTSQQSYENLLRHVSEIFEGPAGPELTAYFCRIYATLSVPFLLDYTRRFGQFSRRFLAEQVHHSMNPGFFDFVRYQGAVKPLPLMVTNPWSLSSYTKLLAPSSLKNHMFTELRNNGLLPAWQEESDIPDVSLTEKLVRKRPIALDDLMFEENQLQSVDFDEQVNLQGLVSLQELRVSPLVQDSVTSFKQETPAFGDHLPSVRAFKSRSRFFFRFRGKAYRFKHCRWVWEKDPRWLYAKKDRKHQSRPDPQRKKARLARENMAVNLLARQKRGISNVGSANETE